MKSDGRPYTEFQYLRNPRTEVKHAPEFLDRFERMGWLAQLKLNGTRSGVYVPPDRQPFAWNRHGEPHRQWAFTKETATIFRRLRGKRWCVFDGELMHAKTTHIKNIHYLYDILVYNGVHLVRTTYAERYKILEGLFKKGEEKLGHWVLDDYTWLAINYTSGFRRLFDQTADMPEVEGLVLKDPNGVYYTWDARSWMIKFRRK